MSEVEHKRGMLLLTMQRAGTITRLRFQPRYDLVVNGQKVGVYTADVEYYEAEKLIVEDTKPENSWTISRPENQIVRGHLRPHCQNSPA